MARSIGPQAAKKEEDADLNIDAWEPEDPLWMTKMPLDVDSNPAYAAIHSIIYEGASPEEVASNFKAHSSLACIPRHESASVVSSQPPL